MNTKQVTRKLFLMIAAVTATLCIGVVSGHANLITGGDFPGGGGSFATKTTGQSFDGWTVVSGSVDLIGGYWQAPGGSGGSVDMDGNAPGSISQSFGTTAGHTYKLTFYLSGNPDGGTNPKSLAVDFGGAATNFTYTVTGTKTNMKYVEETLIFTATGNSTTLTFTSKDTGGYYGPVIGHVDVSAVPEPSTLLLLGSGLLGLAGFKKKTRAV